jgi:riboflavin synthase
MFTGIVEALAGVAGVEPIGPAKRLIVSHARIARECRLGDSVAINGCCLTVVACDDETLTFDAGPETLARTNLGGLSPGDRVNVERSLTPQAPLGGHFVLGHVDATGHVESSHRDGQWETKWFRVPPAVAAQLVPKGSIAVDGVSLTVVEVEADQFSVALIPHTLQHTTLGFRQVGDAVNLETDILGKYVFRFLENRDPLNT